MEKMTVKPAEGKLGILVVGCGAVATTFMTGVFMTRKGLAKPVGSMDSVRQDSCWQGCRQEIFALQGHRSSCRP